MGIYLQLSIVILTLNQEGKHSFLGLFDNTSPDQPNAVYLEFLRKIGLLRSILPCGLTYK